MSEEKKNPELENELCKAEQQTVEEEKVKTDSVPEKKNFYTRHKKLCRILGGIAAFLIILLLFLGPIVRVCAELIVPAAIGLPVKIGSLSINLFTGNIGVEDVKVGDSKGVNADHFVMIKRVDVKLYRGWSEVRDIYISNPEGFKERYILILKHARVDLNPDTLTAAKLELEEVLVDGLELYYEPQIGGKNNVEKLQEYVIETFKITEQEKTEKEPQKIQVDELCLKNISVSTVVVGQNLKLPVVPIELNDLGKGPEGVTGGDVFLAVLDRLSMGAGSAITEHAKTLGAGTVKILGEIGTQSAKGVDNAGKQIKSGVDGLKNLFGSKEKK